MDNRYLLLLSAATTAGVAVATFAVLMLRLINRPRRTSANAWEFEARRRISLCDGSMTYRWLEPLVDELAAYHRKSSTERYKTIRTQLTSAGNVLPWDPEEFVAVKELEGLMMGAIGFGLGFTLSGVLLGIVFGATAFTVFVQMFLKDVAERAARRIAIIKRRLPFAVDLIALMLESGAGLMDSINTLKIDLRGHPLGDELASVVAEVNLGRSVREGLVHFQQRIPDEDIAELVFMVNKGDEFGTPMASTFRNQADQMRLKRSQWAEKASGAAEVAIVLPGMLIMIACLLIISAPFLLSLLQI